MPIVNVNVNAKANETYGAELLHPFEAELSAYEELVAAGGRSWGFQKRKTCVVWSRLDLGERECRRGERDRDQQQLLVTLIVTLTASVNQLYDVRRCGAGRQNIGHKCEYLASLNNAERRALKKEEAISIHDI